MNRNKTVVIGLSGGVDSAVSALLLKKQGYQVIAVFMQNWDPITNMENNYQSRLDKCDTQYDYDDALAIANQLDIPLYKVDFIKQYWDNVFLEFIEKYKNNLTPNPDVLCNKYIKFKAFQDYCFNNFKCDYIATGHYANTKNGYLIQAKDKHKDQTYFLCELTNKQLKNVIFPLSKLTKDKVRKIAQKNNLINANKKDSVGICFIGERNLKEFLKNYITPIPGNIIDITTNEIVQTHQGSCFYTIGQRKGLNLGGLKEKYFVCKKVNNDIYIAPNSQEEKYLFSNECVIENFNWIKQPNKLFNIYARFRHTQKLQKVNLNIINNKVIVKYKGQKNIVCGQYCALYQNQFCLGGGEIVKVTNNH